MLQIFHFCSTVHFETLPHNYFFYWWYLLMDQESHGHIKMVLDQCWYWCIPSFICRVFWRTFTVQKDRCWTKVVSGLTFYNQSLVQLMFELSTAFNFSCHISFCIYCKYSFRIKKMFKSTMNFNWLPQKASFPPTLRCVAWSLKGF